MKRIASGASVGIAVYGGWRALKRLNRAADEAERRRLDPVGVFWLGVAVVGLAVAVSQIEVSASRAARAFRR